MKTAAIICEYDPLHNGHAYLIEKALHELQFDRVICIMSGNYVQRGAPALRDKYTRAGWALAAGADMVLEIPTVFSTSSSAEFAACAVRIAEATGIVDSLLFGVEDSVQIHELENAALSAVEEDPALVREFLKSGMTYPEALSQAQNCTGRLSANNILAAEYLRALKEIGSSIEPVAVTRIGDEFAAVLPKDLRFTSATAIRSLLKNGNDVSAYVPSFVLPDLYHTITPDALSPYLSMKLLTESDLTIYHDVSREIGGRLIRRRNRVMSFTERIADTKTKQYTYTRISRALLHIALGIRREDFRKEKELGYVRCLRILGIRKGSPLTTIMKEKTALPIVGRTAQYEDLLGREILYDQLYYSLTGEKGEYDRSPVILDPHDLG